ncbi:13408_t:CDS:2 [Funneliformis caledonium]|uniref:13408_t:CDS:1 n=2 Tax=Funneliformis TaxID=1117308 RepID=A0A9N8V9E6_9GLOM|nr:13408_t:CDS:2 [Funneliformis caledonium]CAG8622462.1 7119_t:CDS:2 [Funneliformis mosseae]
MKKAHETVIGFLNYEQLLFRSSQKIKDFLWIEGENDETSQSMTTRMVYSPNGPKGTKFTKKARDI